MPRIVSDRGKAVVKPQRPVGRPARFTPELATRICNLIATGSTLRSAAKTCGVGWRTIARWNIERPEFRAAYEEARATRTLVWAEQCLDIVDNATGDYVKNPKTGKQQFNHENVHRAKLRVEERHWQMARLDPRLWGDKQQVDLKHDYSQMTEAERLKKAYELIGLIEEIKRGPEMPPPLEYRWEEADEEPQPPGIGGRLRRL
jgi:hypothetical protein